MTRCLLPLVAALLGCFELAATAEPPALTEALVVDAGRRAGRSPVWTDPVEYAWVTGAWSTPSEGDAVAGAGDEDARWTTIPFDENGSLEDRALRNGYALVTVHSDVERIVMLEASGHSAVRVNGESRAGDPYNSGIVRLPILLRAGTNELLFRCQRGRLRAKLTDPPAELFLLGADDTVPDLVGEGSPGPAGVVVVNATTEWTTATVGAHQADTFPSGEFIVHAEAVLAPLSVRKVAINLPPPMVVNGDTVNYAFRVVSEGRTHGKQRTVGLRVASPGERHDRTFLSAIDGSVQYYTVVPPTEAIERPALVLTLHGASVEGRGQAAAYAAKDWCAIVAPTNRRPFGFDWEDWGRLDAMEVLDLAMASLDADPTRVYLTGHSMGGHGTWNIGVNFPGRFAAIAPSAGWVSFWSYTGATDFDDASTVENTMRRAVSSSDTLALVENLKDTGVYILHGDADDNVPVAQARTMRTRLAEFHRDWSYYEQPGAGHWWGNQCVDWDPLFAFLKWHTTPDPAKAARFVFTTADPGVNSRCHWLGVEQQQRWGGLTRVEANAGGAGIELKTDNALLVSIDFAPLMGGAEPLLAAEADDEASSVRVEIDESEIALDRSSAAGLVRFRRSSDGAWSVAELSPTEKNPQQTGPFKNAYRNRMVFVVGEDAWSIAKARYDAETFWYRGNGSVEIVRAADLTTPMVAGRNIIAYGIAAFDAVRKTIGLRDAPLSIGPGIIRVGGESAMGDDLALLAVVPGPTAGTLIGVVAGTGPAGERLCEQVPTFLSGVGYPDWTILSSDMLRTGFGGVVGTGFFNERWQYDPDQSAWRVDEGP